MTTAKGLTSGYVPMGAVFVAPRVAEPFFDPARRTSGGGTATPTAGTRRPRPPRWRTSTSSSGRTCSTAAGPAGEHPARASRPGWPTIRRSPRCAAAPAPSRRSSSSTPARRSGWPRRCARHGVATRAVGAGAHPDLAGVRDHRRAGRRAGRRDPGGARLTASASAGPAVAAGRRPSTGVSGGRAVPRTAQPVERVGVPQSAAPRRRVVRSAEPGRPRLLVSARGTRVGAARARPARPVRRRRGRSGRSATGPRRRSRNRRSRRRRRSATMVAFRYENSGRIA